MVPRIRTFRACGLRQALPPQASLPLSGASLSFRACGLRQARFSRVCEAPIIVEYKGNIIENFLCLLSVHTSPCFYFDTLPFQRQKSVDTPLDTIVGCRLSRLSDFVRQPNHSRTPLSRFCLNRNVDADTDSTHEQFPAYWERSMCCNNISLSFLFADHILKRTYQERTASRSPGC
jgi:hypothetical protein